MPIELPIKSKFLIFEFDSQDAYTHIYNKRFKELVAVINPNQHLLPEKNTQWSERDLQDILQAIEYLKKVKTL